MHRILEVYDSRINIEEKRTRIHIL